MPKEKKEAWKDSKAKALLRSGILSGEITDTMTPKEVFNLHPEEHGKWNYRNWSASLSRLRNAIAREKSRMTQNLVAYAHDIAVVKSRRRETDQVPWHRSPAYRLLKQDIDEGKHKKMRPRDLYRSRPEYFEHFELKVFRKHVYQEVDSRPKRAIRFEKKKKAWFYPELHTDHPRLRNDDNVDNA